MLQELQRRCTLFVGGWVARLLHDVVLLEILQSSFSEVGRTPWSNCYFAICFIFPAGYNSSHQLVSNLSIAALFYDSIKRVRPNDMRTTLIVNVVGCELCFASCLRQSIKRKFLDFHLNCEKQKKIVFAQSLQ